MNRERSRFPKRETDAGALEETGEPEGVRAVIDVVGATVSTTQVVLAMLL